MTRFMKLEQNFQGIHMSVADQMESLSTVCMKTKPHVSPVQRVVLLKFYYKHKLFPC